MLKKACHSELVSETNKGGESLPLARTSLLATPSSGGHPRNAPVDTSIEVPYELPEGWKWCKQNEVCRLTDGEKKTDVSYPYLEVKYLRGNKEKEFVTSGKFIKAGTKVILVDGENSGEVFTVPEDGYMGSTFKALSIQNVDEKYLQFFIQTKKDLYRNNKKGSAIPHLNKDLFFNMPFPLPPTLAEQQRIVNRIETMFAKLDQAQKKAQSVLDSFETRKAAILHKAFTGELTANWRKENGVADDSWEEKLFDSCIAKMQNGISKRSGSEGEETVVLRLANIGENDFDVSDLRTIKLTSKEQDNYSLTRDDVVMIRVNGSKTNVGRQILVNNNNGWSFCDHIIRIKYETFCMPSYMVYFSHTKEYKDYVQDNMVSSAGQNTISRKGLSNLRLKIPSLPEQQEIVRILDTVLEKETRAKEAAQTVLDQIALLKKSILARAFRGEL